MASLSSATLSCVRMVQPHQICDSIAPHKTNPIILLSHSNMQQMIICSQFVITSNQFAYHCCVFTMAFIRMYRKCTMIPLRTNGKTIATVTQIITFSQSCSVTRANVHQIHTSSRLKAFDWQFPVKSSSPGQNGRHFAGDIFKRIFLNEKVRFFTKISLKFVPECPINNNPALV